MISIKRIWQLHHEDFSHMYEGYVEIVCLFFHRRHWHHTGEFRDGHTCTSYERICSKCGQWVFPERVMKPSWMWRK